MLSSAEICDLGCKAAQVYGHHKPSLDVRRITSLFPAKKRRIPPIFIAIITNVSSDTALRDIKDLIEKGILKETGEGGRSVNYELVDYEME